MQGIIFLPSTLLGSSSTTMQTHSITTTAHQLVQPLQPPDLLSCRVLLFLLSKGFPDSPCLDVGDLRTTAGCLASSHTARCCAPFDQRIPHFEEVPERASLTGGLDGAHVLPLGYSPLFLLGVEPAGMGGARGGR